LLELQLRVAGVLLLLLAAFNAQLPRRFGWRRELQAVSLLTRQVFFVHAFFIALLLVLVGLLYLLFPERLLQAGGLGGPIAWGSLVFWGTRLAFQFFVYSPELWRGNRLLTLAHVLASLLWAYLAAVNGWLAVHHWGA
jgi:hypothetical protein